VKEKVMWKLIKAIILSTAALILLGQIRKYIESVFFTFPVALISSAYFNSPLEKISETSFLIKTISLEIVSQCSGYNFFIVLVTLIIFQFVLHFQSLKLIYILMLPLVYPFIILINGLRIISSFYIGQLFPAEIFTVVHQWIGMLIFIPVLVSIYLLIERIPKYE
jgi:exosortase/archaeosortase family protein